MKCLAGNENSKIRGKGYKTDSEFQKQKRKTLAMDKTQPLLPVCSGWTQN